MTGEFRQYLFPHDHPRLAEVRGLDAYAYREAARTPGTFTGDLVAGWTPLYRNEFRGVTEDGTLRAGLLPARPRPTRARRRRSPRWSRPPGDLLAALDDDGRERIRYPVDAVEWQTWANPEFMQFDTGLRLEFQPAEVREAALALVRASLSPEGYELAHAMMLINGFLGEVVGLETVLNEFSYNIALYGEPDLRAPWGWQLFGHHCAVNCLVVEGRMVLSPVFLGAEPNEIDAGPHAGATSFTERIELGHRADGRAPDGTARAPRPSTSRWSTRRCRPAGCTPATSGTWPARSRTTGSSRSRASASPRCPRRRRNSCWRSPSSSSRCCPRAARRPAAGDPRAPATRPGSAGSAGTSPATSSTTASSRRCSSPSSTTTAASSSTTTPRSRSTSTPCCAPRTATTTAAPTSGSGSSTAIPA